MDFETALRAQIEADPSRRRRGRRILGILDSRPSARRTRQIQRMESHAAVHLGMRSTVGIDWSKVDWAKVIDAILELLTKLLPLILAL